MKKQSELYFKIIVSLSALLAFAACSTKTPIQGRATGGPVIASKAAESDNAQKQDESTKPEDSKLEPTPTPTPTEPTSVAKPTQEENKPDTESVAAPKANEVLLAQMINEYRIKNKLPEIRVSKSLSKVAQVHARNLQNHHDLENQTCNAHSWYDEGKAFKSCCYTSDHAQAKCMWDKPREITAGIYKGNGYEIAFSTWSSEPADGKTDRALPLEALNGWQSSPGHNSVMINLGMWKQITWKSFGVAIYGDYAVAWFGDEKDPAGYFTP